jgi:hypothetical protein
MCVMFQIKIRKWLCIRSDDDGINNNVDIDNDNDGITNCTESYGNLGIDTSNLSSGIIQK